MIPLSDLIAALGSDADSVAAFLSERGFRGVRGEGEDCPLADYFRCNGLKDVAVERECMMYTQGSRTIVEELPEPLSDFVMMFDDGSYPHLETPPDV